MRVLEYSGQYLRYKCLPGCLRRFGPAPTYSIEGPRRPERISVHDHEPMVPEELRTPHCKPCRWGGLDLIDQFCLNQLSPDLNREMEEHILTCSRCAEEVALTKEFIEALRSVSVLGADGTWEVRMRGSCRSAGSAAI